MYPQCRSTFDELVSCARVKSIAPLSTTAYYHVAYAPTLYLPLILQNSKRPSSFRMLVSRKWKKKVVRATERLKVILWLIRNLEHFLKKWTEISFFFRLHFSEGPALFFPKKSPYIRTRGHIWKHFQTKVVHRDIYLHSRRLTLISDGKNMDRTPPSPSILHDMYENHLWTELYNSQLSLCQFCSQ